MSPGDRLPQREGLRPRRYLLAEAETGGVAGPGPRAPQRRDRLLRHSVSAECVRGGLPRRDHSECASVGAHAQRRGFRLSLCPDRRDSGIRCLSLSVRRPACAALADVVVVAMHRSFAAMDGGTAVRRVRRARSAAPRGSGDVRSGPARHRTASPALPPAPARIAFLELLFSTGPTRSVLLERPAAAARTYTRLFGGARPRRAAEERAACGRPNDRRDRCRRPTIRDRRRCAADQSQRRRWPRPSRSASWRPLNYARPGSGFGTSSDPGPTRPRNGRTGCRRRVWGAGRLRWRRGCSSRATSGGRNSGAAGGDPGRVRKRLRPGCWVAVGRPVCGAGGSARRPLTSVDLARPGERWFGTVLASGFDSRVNDRMNAMRWPRGRTATTPRSSLSW